MSYNITSPVAFANVSAGTSLDFQSEGSSKNIIDNFVTTSAGDLIYRNSADPLTDNTLTALSIGQDQFYLRSEAQAQVETIAGWTGVLADYQNRYITFQTINGDYYIWWQTNGTDMDPGLPGTGIEADIQGLSGLANSIRGATSSAFQDPAVMGEISVADQSFPTQNTITQVTAGARAPTATNSLVLTITLDQQGQELRPTWADFSAATTTEIDAQKNIANGIAGLDGSSMVQNAQLPIGTPGGIASLNGSSMVPIAQLPAGQAFGIAELDSSTMVPITQLPVGQAFGIAELDGSTRVPNAQLPIGIANGVASLDGSTVVPVAQLPAGLANGVASLDGSAQVLVAQIPPSIYTSPSETFLARGIVAGTNSVATGTGFITLDNGGTNNNCSFTTSANFGHDAGSVFTATNGTFSVPTTGVWNVGARVTFQSNPNGLRRLRLDINGANQPIVNANATASTGTVAYGPTPLSLSSGDSVSVEVGQNSGASLNVAACEFYASLVAQ